MFFEYTLKFLHSRTELQVLSVILTDFRSTVLPLYLTPQNRKKGEKITKKYIISVYRFQLLPFCNFCENFYIGLDNIFVNKSNV